VGRLEPGRTNDPATQPTSDQLRKFTSDDHSGEIAMVNLLKFRDRALYRPEDPEHGFDTTGADAYARFRAEVAELRDDPTIGLAEVYAGPAAGFFIGEGDWDYVTVMRYPSRGHLLKMVGDERYQAAHRHREAGLLYLDLVETRPE
jgi:hypothetical protein